MNVEPTQQPTTDDPALAQVLAENNDQTQQSTDTAITSGLQFEETPLSQDNTSLSPEQLAPADNTGINDAIDQLNQTAPEPTTDTPQPSSDTASLSGGLEDIKKDALGELRPLVDKLSLPADEKFDIMLLIIRSTDDQTLVASAHAAAKQIEDETKRAQALLDVVKEIDYFANQGQ